jgi:hypothetical protein
LYPPWPNGRGTGFTSKQGRFSALFAFDGLACQSCNKSLHFEVRIQEISVVADKLVSISAELVLHSALPAYFERLLMPRLVTIMLAIALSLAISGCGCNPWDSRCQFSNVPASQP